MPQLVSNAKIFTKVDLGYHSKNVKERQKRVSWFQWKICMGVQVIPMSDIFTDTALIEYHILVGAFM